MRRFFLWLFNRPTHEQQTISRLLDMYERLLDRTLESRGLEGVRGEGGVSVPPPSSSPSNDVFDEEVEQRAEIEEYAANAAMSPELFEQAVYNAIPGNHPQAERWKEVVKRAEEIKVFTD